MIGRSMLDQGDLDGAVTTFRATLELAELDPTSVSDIRYQLGLSLEAAGRMQEALSEFEQIYAKAPSYPQVASKIRALRKALERD
jgi:tetratricopeptide (TPR) repeat protein